MEYSQNISSTTQRASFTQPNASTTITTTTAARDNWQQPPEGERTSVSRAKRGMPQAPAGAQKCSEYTTIVVALPENPLG